MTHLFIINPAAGSRDRTESYTKNIRKVCDARGLPYRIEVSGAPGECCRIAREAAQTGEEYRIYACGGDGTLNEVVAGVAGFDNASVTCYRGGSGNDFIKLFSDPDAFLDLERLLDCEEATFDLMRCNDDICLNICSVGLDARIGTDVSNYKRLPLLSGFRAYAISTVINVIRGISEHYVVEIDGERIDGEQTMICACNGQYYGGGFHCSPKSSLSDGKLNLILIEAIPRVQFLGLLGPYRKGEYFEKLGKRMLHKTVKTVEIRADKPLDMNLDGEILSIKNPCLTVIPSALNLILPIS